ncbi:hypothetical protein DQ238_05690 [Geodermatophilus sp. TF02-6]|nr:hypothetical protein DQ238_05690 [Geodermatophilus sp. TF02-6]
MAVADGRVWACPTCGDDREFVQPPCVDGHTEDGGECPEWACTDCGTALVTGAGVDVEAVSAGRGA